MRFLFNLLGGILLAFALVFAVADIARTLADGTTTLMPVGEALALVGLPAGGGVGADLSGRGIDLLGAVGVWPASITLGLAAFLLLFIGRPPHRRRGRLAR